jgi:hypothetical protein
MFTLAWQILREPVAMIHGDGAANTKEPHMTPIKLDAFLEATSQKPLSPKMDLADVGLYHAAPRESDRVVLFMRFDPSTGVFFEAC